MGYADSYLGERCSVGRNGSTHIPMPKEEMGTMKGKNIIMHK
jgi:hypothetical protein